MTRATLALALVVSASAALPASRADRTLFYEARAAEQRLHASKRAEASRVQWNRVVLRYRRIVALYPRSPYCDDALMAIGDLSRDMAARFQDPRLKDEAVDAYRMLVSEYPSSSLGDRALFAAFEIAQEGGQRKDVLSAGRRYLGAFPKGSHASAVRAALRESPPERASARSAPASDLAQVINLRFWSGASSTRVVVDLERQVEIHQDRISGPERLWVDLVGTRLQPNLTDRSFPVGDGLLERIRIGQHAPGTVRVVLDFKSVRSHQVFYLTDPARLVIDVRGTPPVTVADSSTTPAEAAASRVPSPANPEPAADSPADAAPSAESPTASGEATGASSPPATLALQVPSPAMSA
ncbi:MAG TPA: AMIN domain-containing protein, partial [Vicinamibacteria bacterium]